MNELNDCLRQHFERDFFAESFNADLTRKRKSRCRDAGVVESCVSELKAIPVVGHPESNCASRYVLEIDVIPMAHLCKDRVFSVKMPCGGTETFFRVGSANRRKQSMVRDQGTNCLAQLVRWVRRDVRQLSLSYQATPTRQYALDLA